jgi:hypothetical protein
VLYSPTCWAAGYGNLTIGYEHGYDFPPAEITRIALVLTKTWLGGQRPFEITGSGFLPGCSIGRASDILIVPFVIATGTIARGELLINNNEQDARKYAGTGRVIGVCTHASTAATSTKVQHALKAGNTADTQVKNTSGVSIPPNTYLKTHASGGVQAVGTLAAGEQMIGRSTATIADAALGPAEIFNF